MSDVEIIGFNQFISALLMCDLLALIVLWAWPVHCGTACETCRPKPNRKH